jgi:homoserine kinase type II
VAVYTTLSELQVNEMLARFQLPVLACMEGVSAGIENTTYFLTLSDQRRFVLTLFEMLDANQLPPYVQLTHHYHLRGLPVPSPLLDRSGTALQYLAHKPALLFPRAAGQHAIQPSLKQCSALGKVLAQMHLATSDFSVPIPNPCGLLWAEHSAARLISLLDANDQRLLTSQLALGRTLQALSLPRGIIHGDLFRDNVLFEDNQVSAIIDFYNAGTDFLLLDLAIAVNDWCFDGKGAHNELHQSGLMDAYQSLRPLTPGEIKAWPDFLQWAACRFWLSRLAASPQAPVRSIKTALKDPLQYRNLLLFHSAASRC